MNCPECCEKEIEVLCRCKRCQWYWRPKISVERLEAAIKEPPRAESEHETAMRVYGEYEKARWAKAFKDSTVCGIILFRDWLTSKIAEKKGKV